MRNPISVLKSLEENANTPAYRYERLYRNLYNPEFYLLAYRNIAASQGSMTAGADGMTLDDMSMARINRIIASLKDHSYQPNPARRTYIAKKNSSKKRPLGIPSTNDKLVQEIIRMLLEAIYEPTFSKHSHGFRPHRSCHTALEDIEARFKGVKWVVEGDIEACFDSFDHHVLIELLRKRIKDEQFISLMWKFLKAGYMEQWTYHRTYTGTPQGSGMSPILANIYLSELDHFLERYAAWFNTPEKRRSTSEEHGKARYQHRKAKRMLEANRNPETVAAFKEAQKRLLDTPYRPVMETDYKRLQYCRYADDFVVGVVGSKSDAEQVKRDIGRFLSDKLKLTLSEKKTMVTHSGDLIRFLGYDFTVSRDKHVSRNENGIMQRFHYGKVRFYVPHEKWLKKLLEYKALKIHTDEKGNEQWKSIHRGILINRTDVDIVGKYNSEIRGLYNFYRMAVNVSVLNKFYFIMKGSMVRTFACKYKTSFKEIMRRYAKDGIFRVKYEGKTCMKTCEFYHDGFTMQRASADLMTDTLPQYRKYDQPNSLARRLRGGVCEMCGTRTDEIHMHHVKSLKKLTGKNEFEARMLDIRRRSLALCGSCYEEFKNISSK